MNTLWSGIPFIVRAGFIGALAAMLGVSGLRYVQAQPLTPNVEQISARVDSLSVQVSGLNRFNCLQNRQNAILAGLSCPNK